MRKRRWVTGLALAAAVVVTGCRDADDDSASADSAVPSTGAVTTPATTTRVIVATTASTVPTTSDSAAATAADTTAATTAATVLPTEPTSPTDDGSATAVVEIGGERFDFRVIQCLRDRPSVLDDRVVDLTLDGVPPDTPDELIEPLLDVMDPDTDMVPLLEPVLEYGPALTVSRFEDGGDYVVVYDLADIEYVSDPDPLSPDARFLSIADGDSGIPIAGATTSGGIPLAIAATCP